MSSIITIVHTGAFGEDRIAALWQTLRFARLQRDRPYLWKLTDPYLDAIAEFFNIGVREEVLTLNFLDCSIDASSLDAVLVADQSIYPVGMITGQKPYY